MKDIEIRDHIGIYNDVYSDTQIKKWISYFDHCSEVGLTYKRHNDLVRDEGLDVLHSFYHNEVDLRYIIEDFHQPFFDGPYTHYTNEYAVLKTIQCHRILDVKVQKTVPGQGHIMHGTVRVQCMKTDLDFVLSCCISTMLKKEEKLNSFIKRLGSKPVKNQLLIWPAGYTHTHRGNPPISGAKYILTGWVETS